MLEIRRAPVYFAMPEMYGGFSYALETDGEQSRLIVESWCRVAGGSGQRHVVSAAGSTLIDEGSSESEEGRVPYGVYVIELRPEVLEKKAFAVWSN